MSLNPPFFGMGNPLYWDSQYPYRNSSSVNNSLPQALPQPRWDSETADFGNTRVVWKESPGVHVFHANLPGVKKEEVKVEVLDGRILQISRQRGKEDETDTWHWEERGSGSFVKRFRLPENAKVDQVKASMENGVLTVTVPKEEVKKPHVKEIEISGQ